MKEGLRGGLDNVFIYTMYNEFKACTLRDLIARPNDEQGFAPGRRASEGECSSERSKWW